MSFDTSIPSAERIKADVSHLKEWISKQPHLPNIDDDDWLETFLHRNKFSLEKTKFKLENYYSLRTKYPELLKNRDPVSRDLLQTSETLKIGVSDTITKDNTRIIFFSYGENAHLFNAENVAKKFFMIMDMMLLDKENRHVSLVTLTDFQKVKLEPILKVMTILAKVAEIFVGAYSEKLKAMHFINVPSFTERFLEPMKKCFPPKIAGRMYFHLSSESSLFEKLDANVVCRDFGGTGNSLDELKDLTQRNLEKHARWFKEQDDVCSNELLRPKIDGLEEMKGSFRKLEID